MLQQVHCVWGGGGGGGQDRGRDRPVKSTIVSACTCTDMPLLCGSATGVVGAVLPFHMERLGSEEDE